MCRMWDFITPHSYYSLGETLHFITIICKSCTFLPHWDVSNECVIYCQYNHNLSYLRNVQTVSSFSSLLAFVGISKCIDSEVLFTFGSGGEGKCSFCFVAGKLEFLVSS